MLPANPQPLAQAQLLCCGVWQPITTLPHQCGQCGRTYLHPKGA